MSQQRRAKQLRKRLKYITRTNASDFVIAICGTDEKQIRRAMTVIDEPTYSMTVQSAAQYAQNVVHPRMRHRAVHVQDVASKQLRGRMRQSRLKEYLES